MSIPSDLPALEDNSSSQSSNSIPLAIDDSPIGISSTDYKKPKSYKNIIAVGIVIVLVIGIIFVLRHKFSHWKKTMPHKKDLSEETKKDLK